jgi:A/G-specific adenine glycosylase
MVPSRISFQNLVWRHYRQNGRHDLPWRKSNDPYRILVSEVMLQQTQVERVIPFYQNFLAAFPTLANLAKAPLSDVLKAWQGLGYNRRAKMLHQAAKKVVTDFGGVFPKTAEALDVLPGVGPYTARAVAAFAHNDDGIFIETNIRTVITHHFFPKKKKVSDEEVLKILTKVYPKGKAREWYAALMDYGSFLKRSGVKLNARSKHYTKQKTFKGSNREARGAILKELSRGSRSESRLLGLLGDDRKTQLKEQLTKLVNEGMVCKQGRLLMLPG